ADRNVYVVGRRLKSKTNTGTDKILIFNGATGACQNWIDLDQYGGPNAYAQALVFGPGGSLYLPVRSSTTPAASDVGGVRRYNVSSKEYTSFVSPIKDGDQLASWWYVSFGQTSPVTLAY